MSKWIHFIHTDKRWPSPVKRKAFAKDGDVNLPMVLPKQKYSLKNGHKILIVGCFLWFLLNMKNKKFNISFINFGRVSSFHVGFIMTGGFCRTLPFNWKPILLLDIVGVRIPSKPPQLEIIKIKQKMARFLFPFSNERFLWGSDSPTHPWQILHHTPPSPEIRPALWKTLHFWGGGKGVLCSGGVGGTTSPSTASQRL